MLKSKSRNRKILALSVCFLIAISIWIPLNQFVKATQVANTFTWNGSDGFTGTLETPLTDNFTEAFDFSNIVLNTTESKFYVSQFALVDENFIYGVDVILAQGYNGNSYVSYASVVDAYNTGNSFVTVSPIPEKFNVSSDEANLYFDNQAITPVSNTTLTNADVNDGNPLVTIQYNNEVDAPSGTITVTFSKLQSSPSPSPSSSPSPSPSPSLTPTPTSTAGDNGGGGPTWAPHGGNPNQIQGWQLKVDVPRVLLIVVVCAGAFLLLRGGKKGGKK